MSIGTLAKETFQNMNFKRLGTEAIGLFVAVGIGFLNANSLYSVTYKPKEMEFKAKSLYESKLEQHGDTNSDGKLDFTERKEFNDNLVKGKKVIFVPYDVPRFLDGNEVPPEQFIEWLENYNPST